MDSTIIDNLPPELQAYLLDFLAWPEKTLFSMVCKGWYKMIQQFYSGLKIPPRTLLCYAAHHGHENLAKLAKKYGASNFKAGMKWAAYGGHPNLMKLMWKWGKSERKKQNYARIAMERAAFRGHPECMKLAKKWGWSKCIYNQGMYGAARGGHLEYMKLVRRWGQDLNKKYPSGLGIDARRSARLALTLASAHGHINCMILVRSWGADNYNRSMAMAAMSGEIDSMKQLKEWGGDQFVKAIGDVMRMIRYEKRDLKQTVKKRRFTGRPGSFFTYSNGSPGRVLPVSQRLRHLNRYRARIKKCGECLKLLKKWESVSPSPSRKCEGIEGSRPCDKFAQDSVLSGGVVKWYCGSEWGGCYSKILALQRHQAFWDTFV